MQTELHRHLDVSVRTSTLLELAQARGLEAQSTSLDAFARKVILRKPMTDLNSVLALFELFQKIYDRPEVFERVAREVVEDCAAEGTDRVELRFSPGFCCQESGLPWQDALDGFERGLKAGLAKRPGMKAGLICIASRDQGVGQVERTVEFYLTNSERFVGLDLAGPEVEFPCKLFEPAFRKAKGHPITIHAGEAAGPENVWAAVELLGARRIGHGIASVKDATLLKHLAEKKICLEMCPTSNWLTQAVPSLEEHPLPRVLRAGVPVCINTDDPGVFGVTLGHEIEICRTRMGLTETEARQCQDHALKASFIS